MSETMVERVARATERLRLAREKADKAQDALAEADREWAAAHLDLCAALSETEGG